MFSFNFRYDASVLSRLRGYPLVAVELFALTLGGLLPPLHFHRNGDHLSEHHTVSVIHRHLAGHRGQGSLALIGNDDGGELVLDSQAVTPEVPTVAPRHLGDSATLIYRLPFGVSFRLVSQVPQPLPHGPPRAPTPLRGPPSLPVS